MTPQIIMLCLLWGGWMVSVVKHGESKGEYDGFWAFISLCITMWILISGGFFKCFGWG